MNMQVKQKRKPGPRNKPLTERTRSLASGVYGATVMLLQAMTPAQRREVGKIIRNRVHAVVVEYCQTHNLLATEEMRGQAFFKEEFCNFPGKIVDTE